MIDSDENLALAKIKWLPLSGQKEAQQVTTRLFTQKEHIFRSKVCVLPCLVGVLGNNHETQKMQCGTCCLGYPEYYPTVTEPPNQFYRNLLLQGPPLLEFHVNLQSRWLTTPRCQPQAGPTFCRVAHRQISHLYYGSLQGRELRE